MTSLGSKVWEFIDNLGHVIKLPRPAQHLLCEKVDSYYTTGR